MVGRTGGADQEDIATDCFDGRSEHVVFDAVEHRARADVDELHDRSRRADV